MNIKSKVPLQLWDSTQLKWVYILIDFPIKLKNNLKDGQIRMKPSIRCKSNMFTNGQIFSQTEHDVINAYASTRLTIDLWEKALGHKIRWPWQNIFSQRKLEISLFEPLTLAKYVRTGRSVLIGDLYSYGYSNLLLRKSFDVIAHETTHAIIDSIYKSANEGYNKEELSIIEALCDLSPMLILFSIPQCRKFALEQTNNDLLKPNIISEFAEGYSSQNVLGMRSALQSEKSKTKKDDMGHDIIHFVYKMLVRTIKNNPSPMLIDSYVDYLASALFNCIKSKEKLSTRLILSQLQDLGTIPYTQLSE